MRVEVDVVAMSAWPSTSITIEATGYAEREAALELLERQGMGAGATLGADKG